MLSESFGESWLELDFPFPCEIHYRTPRRLEPNANYRVLVVHTEPSPLCIPFETIAPFAHFFDLIIASNPQFAALPNALIDSFGGCWATRLPQKKEFSASFLYSLGVAGAVFMNGYAFRIGIYESASLIKIPMRMLRGRSMPEGMAADLPPPTNGVKDCLFESMFSLSIENNSEENYFTEKLVDCFATYTVPIYYGCTNIGRHFNTDGMILVKDHHEAINVLNALSPEDYWARVPFLRENFLASQKFWEGSSLRIRNAILQSKEKQMRGMPLSDPKEG